MQPGRLNQRVALQSSTSTCDAMNQQVVTWSTVKTVWAQVEPLTGRELEASRSAGSVANYSEVDLKVIIRYYPGLTANWRIVHGTKIYSIVAVLNLMSGKTDLKLLCKELPATAV